MHLSLEGLQPKLQTLNLGKTELGQFSPAEHPEIRFKARASGLRFIVS